MTTDTQYKRIAAHLKGGNTITALEALSLFGCFRLASRIHDLRVAGYPIVVERIKTSNGKTVAQYRMQ